MLALTWKQRFLLVTLFGLISISLLSPIASNEYLPPAEFENHISAIIQAKMALKEGQFPIRVAPWQNQGWGNAYFQFYSPLPYMAAGLIYGLSCLHANPFFYYKLFIWLALVLAAVYSYRLTSWLTKSHEIGILSAMAYITAPYFLININTRGDFTEALAQGLIPAIIFYSLRCFYNPLKTYSATFISIFGVSLSWFALATTHLLSFIYTSLFVGLFLLILTAQIRSRWKNLLLCGLGYGLACLLALWYLAPIAMIEKYLYIHTGLSDPFVFAWLTLIPTLLSITLVSPMPLPGNGILLIPLCFAVGWPLLLATGVTVYISTQSRLFYEHKLKTMVATLLILFTLIFLMVWSPVDFWQYLPKILASAQFTYRLLTQLMWTGMILFAFSLLAMFKEKLEMAHVVIGLLLLGLASSSWLPTNKSGPTIPSQLRNNPDLGNGQLGYLIAPQAIPNKNNINGGDLPFTSSDHWLLLNQEVTLSSNIFAKEPRAILQIRGTLPSYLFHSPITLTFEMNDRKLSRKIVPGDFSWNIPLATLAQQIPTDTIRLRFTSKQPYIPNRNDPKSTDNRSLTVQVKTLSLKHLTPQNTLVPVDETLKFCQKRGAETICELTVTSDAELIQLPVLYYPHLLLLKINGKKSNYLPLAYKDIVLTGLRLMPGKYKITTQFIGLSWANWISRLTWTSMLLLMLASIWNSRFKSFKQLRMKRG